MNASLNNRKYLKILRIELEDLEGHITSRISGCLEDQQKKQVKDRVTFANMAVLKSEKLGIERFISIVEEMNPDDYIDLDALVTTIRGRFQNELKATGLASAAYTFAEQKIDKVEKYFKLPLS